MAERRALAVAGRWKTAAASRTFAAVVTLPEVKTRATARWNARAASFAAFSSWLENNAAPWLATHPFERAWFPKRLLPDAAWRSARAWSLGTGGTDPAKLTAEFNAAKTLAIARTQNFTLPQSWHEAFLGWTGASFPGEDLDGHGHADYEADTVSQPFAVDRFQTMRFAWRGWENDDFTAPSGVIVENYDFTQMSWSTLFALDTWGNDTDSPNAPLAGQIILASIPDVTLFLRFKLTQATGLNFRPQLHFYHRWFGV